MADSKQLMLTAPTVHRTLPFCIELCSVHLVGSVVAEHDFELDCDGFLARGKSLCTKRLRLLGKMVQLYSHTNGL